MADPRGTDPVPRFWAKVDKRGEDECWLWTAAVNQRGGGRFSPSHHRTDAAHRFSWVLAGNEIPEGMFVYHTCASPSCVNPRHLRVALPDSDSPAGFPPRFAAKFSVVDSGCWEWKRPAAGGYGYFRTGGLLPGKPPQSSAHRFAYEWINGVVAADIEIDHLCRNPRCVNPDHLEAVTSSENQLRAQPYKKPQTHCVHGHEYTPENTFMMSNGRERRCRTCARKQRQERTERVRAARLEKPE